MTGTHLVVLVMVPTLHLLLSHMHLAATLRLARRHGRQLKSVGWSNLRGYTAEFFDDEEP